MYAIWSVCRKKWNTAKNLVPKPEIYKNEGKNHYGIIFFGTTSYAALEVSDLLAEDGIQLDAMRLTAFPFHESVQQFIDQHVQVFVVEQNRDAQMRTLLINELGCLPSKLISVLYYGGMPITANDIQQQILKHHPSRIPAGTN